MSRRARRLEALLENGASHALVNSVLAKAGVSLNLQDFRGLVDRAGNRDIRACEALGEISQALLPHLPDPRGRRMRGKRRSTRFCSKSWRLGKPCGFTWSPEKEDFADGATVATRISCGNPNFDPRVAHTLLKSGAIDKYDDLPATCQIEQANPRARYRGFAAFCVLDIGVVLRRNGRQRPFRERSQSMLTNKTPQQGPGALQGEIVFRRPNWLHAEIRRTRTPIRRTEFDRSPTAFGPLATWRPSPSTKTEP